jgi:hypothetical protein
LSELIKTKVSIPAEKIASHRPAKGAQKDAGAGPIEVPLTLHIDPNDLDRDVEILLKIRLKRKGK